ncbi:MAG: PilZ domain-containing protein [Nitrospira sp.]|nr:PilZ domain-containing protein [Nitrospira sp.]
MKFSVTSTPGYAGKSLVIDADREVIIVQDASGRVLGDVPWGAVIERVLADDGRKFAHCRAYPRANLAIKVRCTTSDGQTFESLTGGIGGGGLFIESSAPLSVGSELSLEFALPDRPLHKLRAKAKVVWVRNKIERQLMFPGMGVQFVEIDEQVKGMIVNLVDALNRSRQRLDIGPSSPASL